MRELKLAQAVEARSTSKLQDIQKKFADAASSVEALRQAQELMQAQHKVQSRECFCASPLLSLQTAACGTFTDSLVKLWRIRFGTGGTCEGQERRARCVVCFADDEGGAVRLECRNRQLPPCRVAIDRQLRVAQRRCLPAAAQEAEALRGEIERKTNDICDMKDLVRRTRPAPLVSHNPPAVPSMQEGRGKGKSACKVWEREGTAARARGGGR